MANDLYASLSDLKTWLGRDDTDDDAILDGVLAAASRAVDKACDRFFYQLPALTRTFTADGADYLSIPDLVSVSSIATDVDGDRVYETAWTAGSYDLTPDNAADEGLPYTAIRTVILRPSFWFPTFRRGVRVTGTWGWPAVPDGVATATLILATRLFRRTDTPLGMTQAITVSGASMVRIPENDPDLMPLLAPFRRLGLSAV